ncbi:non-canonical purine NTP pyrophosphatase [Candidatus Woesearchaeota archaeon]|nr:non-canonical purine NTP pyrophosphatase [Candidatus Woesearchaeota archaeon]
MPKRKLCLITTNLEKYNEIKVLLQEVADIERIEDNKIELKEDSIEQTALSNAEFFANKYKKAVIIDDGGLFFAAYPQFPGPHPKLMYKLLGYKGLLKLLEGESRKAIFRTALAYCEPGKKPELFVGEMVGRIAEQPADKGNEYMPYERIFIADASKKLVCDMSREDKNKISHRAMAVRRLKEWLK